MTLTSDVLGIDDGVVGQAARRKMARVARRLSAAYGQPSLGNCSDPIDEIAFIVLSARTTETLYVRAFENLKRRYPRWTDLLGATPEDIQKQIAVAGLGQKRAAQLLGCYRRLWSDFSEGAAAALRRMTAKEVFEYLTALPGISAKSALCVMMWSLGHDVLPADTHVARVMSRLGVIPTDLRPEYAQRAVAPLAPTGLSKNLHTGLVLHGRTVCRRRVPLCANCCIRRMCPWPKGLQK